MIDLGSLFAGLLGRAKRAVDTVRGYFARPYRSEIVSGTLPEKLQKRRLYVVVDDGFQEQAAMLCPCGCKGVLHMNLLPDERPCWRFTQHHDGTASLHP